MSKTKTIWVGVIPDIFGYGINVASDTREGVVTALGKAYDDWKVSHPNPTTNFDKSFDYYGGYVVRVELDKGYHAGFNS